MNSELTISTEGDAMAATLLEHANFVRALARRLVRDACEAEDLEQDAWLAALQRRAALPADSRGWLARKLRTRAGNRRREAERRRQREGRSARSSEDEGPDAIELAERVELRQRVVAAVLALDEPYRSTVLLRYESGLSPSRIADRTGESVATVKTRLRRALAQLRERLDREAGGDGRKWLAGLAPLLDDSPATAAGLGGSGLVLLAGAAVLAIALPLGFRAWGGTGGGDGPDPVVPAVAVNPPETEEELQAIAAAESAERRASVETEPLAPEVVPVRIVDAFSREPLAGASLWYVTVDGEPRAADARRDALPAGGTRLHADARGLVRVPAGAHPIAVYARHDDRYARTFLEPDDPGTVEIGLRPSSPGTLRVRVLDADGELAPGVGVLLQYTPHDQRTRRLALAVEEDGTVAFEDLAELVERTRWGTTWRLQANRLRATESVEVDPRALPTEPVVLRLPRSGTLILRFVDEEGLVVGSLPGVWLSSGGSVGPANPAKSIFVGPVRNGELTINHVRLAEVWEDVPEGELSVEYMLSAQEWKVTVPPGPGIPREVRAIVAGPREPDEVVARTIRLVAATDPLRGRFLDRDGDPVVDREVLYTLPRLRDAVALPPARTVITDAHGYFSFPVPDAGYRRPRGPVRFLLPAPDGRQPEIGRWELPRRWPSEGVEAGDITLAPPGRLVCGLVVDDSGTAVPGAVVEVGVKPPPTRGGDVSEPGPSVPLGGLGYAGTADSSTLTYHVEADERGQFELLVAIGDGEVVLTASKIGHGPAAPVALGATDERALVTLPRDGAIVGSITLPEGLEATRLRVGLKGDDPHRPEGPLGDLRELDAGGHFRLRRVPAGRRTVEIRVDELRAPILEVEGVLVRSGELSTDPRLQEIGLARALRTFDLEITDELGVAIPEGSIVWAATDDPDAVERPIVFRNGRGRFVTPPGVFRAEVNARAYRRLELPVIEERQRVVMSAGVSVRLRLPDDLELPPPPARLSATLLATEGGEEPDRRFFDRAHVEFRRTVEPPPFDHGRSVDCILPTPGTWRVWWQVGPLDWQGSSGGIEGPRTIEVRDLDELQSFDVSPDAATYAGILDRTR